ncbi:hypothetical protein [Spongiactinospora sp. TRM90649]|uniref:hypothetical protein n=1 Tax=Spongiactinospora sp. TRM90649 TaxID=3031114 RepID=UPI0023F91A99|nr:hypothetical protein [Spongiactinospora sp. TRM90649]MDF5757706.1 hypothetical protein [Spongiactinospora sp. TRM90649]
MVSVVNKPRLKMPAVGRGMRPLAILRRHRWFAGAFALGGLLRLITMLGYRPALWFNDSYEYVSVALHPYRPHPIRPNGYGFYLLAMEPLHSFSLVVFTQHLMGLATAVLVYLLLSRKFGLPGWGATLAAVPVLFDAYQIQLEHLIMSDALFILLVVGVITLVLWHRRMSWRIGAAVGLLCAFTALTRSIGLAILALVVVYLLIKRVGWRPIAAMITACAVPVLGYMGWFASTYGTFAMTSSDGPILYMRTALFADCHKMGVDKRDLDLALLCIVVPKEKRGISGQGFLWWNQQGQKFHIFPAGTKFSVEMNENASRFATRAIMSQPGDYLAVVARDFFRAFRWDRPVFPDASTYLQYEFPRVEKPLPSWDLYRGKSDSDAEIYERGSAATQIVAPWADFMQGYQRAVHLPGIVLGGLLLIGLYGVALRWRKLGGPVLLPWLAALGLILAPAATAEFDYRYVLPAVPLACLAAGITLRHGVRVPAPLRRALTHSPGATGSTGSTGSTGRSTKAASSETATPDK